MGTKKNWHRRLRLTASIATALVCLDALAADPFGFPIGMSRKAAEEAAATMGLGISRWLGTSLIVSQALTLFTTPVVYLWFDRIQRFMRP